MSNELNLNEIEASALPGFKFQGATIGDLITASLPYVFFLAGLLLLLYLIYGGFRLLSSGGDPKGIAGGKTIITNALIGFLLVFVAFWIVQLIALILGLDPILDVF